MTVYYYSKNPGGHLAKARKLRFSIDQPCVTVMAEGMGGDSISHWLITDDGRPDVMTQPIPRKQSAPPRGRRQLFDQDKPPYRVPTVAEVAKIEWNGFTVASTFAGAGGSSLGYRMAGFRVVWANEFVPAAVDCYRLNSPSTIVDSRDIAKIAPAEILKATGLKAGELDVLDGSPPCFAAGTLILTRRGLTPIEDVREGDDVVTHQGRWRRVTGVTKRSAATVSARGHGHPGIITTAEHPFYVREATRPWNGKANERRFGEPEWRPIADCRPVRGLPHSKTRSWFWAMPAAYPAAVVPEVCRSDARISPTKLCAEFFWIVGLWLGDGWLRTGRAHVKGGSRGEVLICAAKKDAAEVRNRIEAAGLAFSEAEYRTTIRFTICHTGLAEWLEEDFGRGAGGKTVANWAFGMPKEWRRALYDGYMFADGTFPRLGSARATSISWPLMLGVAMIARSLGIAAGLRCHVDDRKDHRIEGRRVNLTAASYAMTCFDRPKSFVVGTKHCWGAVKAVEATGVVEPVYNLHVEEDESYVADGLVVHNCQAFSMAGKREKGWGTERRYEHGDSQKNEDLFFEYVRIRDGLMPRTFVAENVAGLVKGTAKGYFVEILRLLKVGYRVEARLLDAQWLGVPQARERVIFIGVRDDLAPLGPAWPTPLPYRYSVRDAIPWIARYVHDTSGLYGSGDVTNRPSPTVTIGINSINSNHFKVDDTAPSESIEFRGGPGGKPRGTKKGHVDDPAHTVTASGYGASGRSNVRVTQKMKYDKRVDVTDDPALTILARGHAGGDTVQPMIEDHTPGVLVQGPEVDFRNKGREIDGDAPAPTVVGGDANKRTPRQFEVEITAGGRGGRRRRESGEPYDPDQPIDTVLADGGRKSSAQFMVGEEAVGVGGRGGFGNVKVSGLNTPAATIGTGPSSGNGLNSAGDLYVKNEAGATTKRKFTIAELRRICSFSDDFQLTGTYAAQWERLGNAVPPLMMKAIAEPLRDKVLIPWRDAQKASKNGRARSK